MPITVGPQSPSAAGVLSPTSVLLTWVVPCQTNQYHIYYRGACGPYVDEGRLDTDHQEHTFDGLQESVNYSFTVNQTGFSGGRVLSIGPVYAKTFTTGKHRHRKLGGGGWHQGHGAPGACAPQVFVKIAHYCMCSFKLCPPIKKSFQSLCEGHCILASNFNA